jgi:signal transduction histidine kinase
MAGRLRLQYRIVIPFALVALIATSAAAFVALSFVSRTLESRVIAQIQNAAAVLGQSDFALNTSILRSARLIAGGEVVTFTTDGVVLATTVDADRQAVLVRAVASPDMARQTLSKAGGPPMVRRMTCEVPCIVAYERVAARADTVVAVVAETSELAAATRAITRSILVAAAFSLLAMILVSQFIARRVTAPLDSLVNFTREVSPGGSTQRARVGDDEIGRLAAAFNEMLDRLDRSRDAAVRSEKLAVAGLLAARVAHDIRNPLASMKMQAQLLAAQVAGDTDTRTVVDAILRDIQHLESVVRDLIELARPGELRRRPTSLNEVIRDVLLHLSPQLSYRKVVVDTHLDAALPGVDLDVERFRQVLLNVIGNAADAMPTGGILDVATSAGNNGSTLVLDVRDDGVGIDPAIRERIFDPFVSTKRDGVGLGLVNAKAVVESHGGSIALSPAAPRGTCVRIVLPAAMPVPPGHRTTAVQSAEQLHG